NNLQEQIDRALEGVSADHSPGLERASAQIRAAFSAAPLGDELAAPIRAAYRALNDAPVAVRSSATAEDLPDVSFAGQQDTYLNVMEEEQVLRAVVACWASLWTARAIGYRLRNQIDQTRIALAVVVQQMAQSDVSGVLFTANPLTGLRSETVIDATPGLGEALVSGQVEPDHYVVDTPRSLIVSKSLGARGISTRARPGGGVETITEPGSGEPSLSDEQILSLARLGQDVEKEYGFPQDIEWAFAEGKLYLLQARPITSLFPVPRVSFDPLFVWFSVGAFQGLLAPVTPLGQECLQRISLGIARALGVNLRFEDQRVLEAAGERIWMNITDVIRNPLGNRLLGGFMGIGEPGSALILREITSDPRLAAGQGHLRFSTLRRLLGFMLPALREIPRTLVQPEKARDRFDARLNAYLNTVYIPGGTDRFERLSSVAAFLGNQGGMADALPYMLICFMPIMGPSLAFLNLIGHLLPRDQGDKQAISMRALDVARGLPRNVTIEMDLMLWQAATLIKQDAAAAEAFASAGAPALAARYLSGDLPPIAQEAVRDFLERYGMRCAGEIDLGQPRWREDPTPILLTLQSYLHITEENAPPRRHAQNVRAAEEAIERMAAQVRAQPGGWIKEKILRAAARSFRLLFGARESPKFYMVRTMGMIRERLLKIGDEFAAAGTILNREDLFYLHVSELEALSRGGPQDWQGLVAGRRQGYERELRRRQVPRILVSDGRAFYEGVDAGSDSGDVITGSPVSPGLVEGRVRVVFDPHSTRIAPGEILVCPGTDPAWTPLFMAAGGLVMEVGGMMTHGSVVAREYGIPAVVGVHEATRRLKDGQRIRLDGTQGSITLIH
ncbi:MAG: PEP/pyruvate-binding domain-containing protein, partial [Bacteroidota bacterium]